MTRKTKWNVLGWIFIVAINCLPIACCLIIAKSSLSEPVVGFTGFTAGLTLLFAAASCFDAANQSR